MTKQKYWNLEGPETNKRFQTKQLAYIAYLYGFISPKEHQCFEEWLDEVSYFDEEIDFTQPKTTK